jgi:DNA polymerase III epsilon subunit-like protein
MIDFNDFNLVFYDLETTSLNLFKAEILELAACYPDGNTFFHSYVTNKGPIDNSNIHGITAEKLDFNNAKPLLKVISDLELWVEARFPANNGNGIENIGENKPIYLIAHNNLEYDKWVLEVNYRKLGRKIPDRWRFMDTLPQLKELCKLQNYKLTTVYQEFIGEPLVGAHGALADTRALYKIYYHLINNIFLKNDIFLKNNYQELFKSVLSENSLDNVDWTKISNTIFSAYLSSNPIFSQLSSHHSDVLLQKIEILGIKGYPLLKLKIKGFIEIKDLMIFYLVSYPNFNDIFKTRSQVTSSYYLGKINKFVETLGYILYGIYPNMSIEPNQHIKMIVKVI